MGSKHNRKLRSKGYRVEVDPLPRWQQDHTKKDQPRRKHGQSNQNSSKISPSPKDKKQMAADYKEIRKLTSKIRSKKKSWMIPFNRLKKKPEVRNY